VSAHHIIDELRWRGLVHQCTDEAALHAHLQQSRSLYCGFDPTADSLHVGSLLPLMTLRRFQRFGHRPIALVGGATGMIGDPSGKSEERNLLNKDVLAHNVAGIQRDVARFLAFEGDNAARVVNNFDWTAGIGYLEFLRDIGKHASVNMMLAKDSIKARIERPDAGISYTEFSYMLLQAYDFAYLSQAEHCTLQIGGSDQWGNITTGTDLGRRMHGVQLFGLTLPLLLTSDGRKMGKTEKGTIWLDAARTSPYAFYQYWLNVADADVLNCLRVLTELTQPEIEALGAQLTSAPGERAAQKTLARWLTQFVHGEAGLQAALRASDILFGAEIATLEDAALQEIFADVPSAAIPAETFDAGISVIDALMQTALCQSRSDAKRALQAGSIYLNNRRVDVDRTLSRADLASATTLVLRNGKKRYALLQIVADKAD
jgi:tyrosyl-tRNA synthetase